MGYKNAVDKYSITYALVYKWTKVYIDKGPEALKCQRRGPKAKFEIDENNLTEVEKLRLELEKEKALRKRREFELEKKRNSKTNFALESKTGNRIQNSRFRDKRLSNSPDMQGSRYFKKWIL